MRVFEHCLAYKLSWPSFWSRRPSRFSCSSLSALRNFAGLDGLLDLVLVLRSRMRSRCWLCSSLRILVSSFCRKCSSSSDSSSLNLVEYYS
jgi:hypothetical protein